MLKSVAWKTYTSVSWREFIAQSGVAISGSNLLPNQEVLFDLVSLGGLFNGNQAIEAMSDLSIEKAAFALCRGGWPASIRKNETSALRMPRLWVAGIDFLLSSF